MERKYSNKERAILAKIVADSTKIGDTIADVSLLVKFVSEQIEDWGENEIFVFFNVLVLNYSKHTGMDAVEIAEEILRSAKRMKESMED